MVTTPLPGQVSPCTGQESHPTRYSESQCGYLQKLYAKGNHRIWRRKYFVLFEDRLCYANTEEDTKTPRGAVKYLPLDQIQVRPIPQGYRPHVGVTMVHGGLLAASRQLEKCCFSIQCGQGTHYMAAESEKEAKRWVRAISNACHFYINTSERTTILSSRMDESTSAESCHAEWLQLEELCRMSFIGEKQQSKENSTQCANVEDLSKTSSGSSDPRSEEREELHRESSQAKEHMDLVRAAQALQEQLLLTEKQINLQESEIQNLKGLQDKGQTPCLETELYRMEVHTSAMEGIGLDSKMLIRLQGAFGSSDDISLVGIVKEKPFRPWKLFQRSSVDHFEIMLEDIGELHAITLVHNGAVKPLWHPTHLVAQNSKVDQKVTFLPQEWTTDHKGSSFTMQLRPGDFVLPKLCIYKVTVRTSEIKGAGTDGNVHMMICGDEEEFTDLPLEESEENFQKGSVDTFMVEAKEVQQMKEIRVAIDGVNGSNSAWHLKQVEIVKEGTKGMKVYFPCDDWITGSKRKHRQWRVLPAVTEDPRSSMKEYTVKVYTGNLKGASTDANIYISIAGERRDSSEIHLPGRLDSFEIGTTDRFTFKWKDLGKLKSLKVWHNNQGVSPDWYLDMIEVQEPQGVVTYFPCADWISGDRELGMLCRELKGVPRDPRKTKSKYKVIVHTSDIRNAGTDATVHVELHGVLGRSGKQILRATREAFARGKTDEFLVESPDVGLLQKLVIGHDNTGPFPGWHLDMVEVIPCQTGQPVYFPCEMWLNTAKGDESIARELHAEFVNPRQELHTYKVSVKTGDCRSAGTSATVSIKIVGEVNDSGVQKLDNGALNLFERGNLDVFWLKLDLLGSLTKVQVRHDNMGHSPSWFLDTIEVEQTSNGSKWFFPCYQWLNALRGDKLITREIRAQSQRPPEDKILTYKVVTITSDVKGAGTSANVTIVMFGSNATSEVLKLESAVDNFEKGQTDEFVFDCKDLGEVKKLRVSHDNSGKRAGWHLHSITIREEASCREWCFFCGQWLDSGIGDKLIERVLLVDNEMPKIVKSQYKITIMTSDLKGAGTDANVSICIHGQKGDSGPMKLSSSPCEFERGNRDVFWYMLADLGPLNSIEIGHDNTSANSSWHLAEVMVENITSGAEWLFPAQQWFDSKIGDRRTRRVLFPGLPRIPANVRRYKLAVYTSNLKGAGTDANILVQLIGEHGETHEKKVVASPDAFERGRLDVLTMEAPELGSLVKLKIGHDNSGSNSAWHLDKVDVVEEGAEKGWVFLCDEWINARDCKGHAIKELEPLDLNDPKAAKLMYSVTTYTGNCRGASCSADVSIFLFGEIRDGRMQKLEAADDKEVFERGKADTFLLNSPFLGDLKEMIVQLDGQGPKTGWFLDLVEVSEVSCLTDRDKPKTWYFPCAQWLATNKGDGKTSRRLTATHDDPRGSKVKYKITILTSDLKGAGTDANVFLTLCGDKSSSGRILIPSGPSTFDRGAKDSFTQTLHELGNINKISIGHDQSGFSPQWHLSEVSVVNVSTAQEWLFLCGRWIREVNASGECVCELEPVDTKLSFCHYILKVHTSLVDAKIVDQSITINIMGKERQTGRIALEGPLDGNETSEVHLFHKKTEDMCPLLKVWVKVETPIDAVGWKVDVIEIKKEETQETWYFPVRRWVGIGKTYEFELLVDARSEHPSIELFPYELLVFTSDIEGAGYDADVYVKIIGEQLTVGPEKLKSVTDSFQKGQESSFLLQLPLLGELTKIVIGLTGNRSNSQWHLEKVLIADVTMGKKFIFLAEKWLGQVGDGLVELEVPLSTEGPRCTYQIVTFTEVFRGEYSIFSLVMFGKELETKEHILELTKLEVGNGKVQREEFTVEDEDVGELCKIHVALVDGGSGWHLSGIQVSVTDRGSSLYFPCNRSLDEDVGDGETSVELLPGLADAEAIPRVEYRVRFYTSNIEKAGTPANVAFVLFGELHRSPEQRVRNHHHNLFRRHSITEVLFECEDLGNLRKLRVWHDSTGFEPSWHLSSATVMNLESGQVWSFQCRQWLDKQHEGRIVYIELSAHLSMKVYPLHLHLHAQSSFSSHAMGKVMWKLVANGDQHSKGSQQDAVTGTGLATMAWQSNEKQVPLKFQPERSEVTYKLTIVTGKRPFAGTNARVYITLFGALGNTGKSNFMQSNEYFSRGSKDVFLMAALDVGNIKALRVGHDGQGHFPGWYLKQIEVQNMNTTEQWRFLCDDWLSPPWGSTRGHKDWPFLCGDCVAPWLDRRLERDYFPVTLVNSQSPSSCASR